MQNKIYIIGFFIAILSTFFYGIMDTAIKYKLTFYPVHFTTFYFQTSIITFSLLVIFLISKSKLYLIKETKKPLLLTIRGSLSVINFFLAFYVLQFLPLDIYYSIVFTIPIIAAIIAIFMLNENLNLIKAISLILGIFGIIIVNNPFSQQFEESYIFPIILTLVLATSVALSGIITRKYLGNIRGIIILLYAFFLSTIFGFFVSFYSVGLEKTLNFNTGNLYITFLVSASCLLGMTLFVKAYKITPIQIVAPTEYVLMIWGIIYGYFIFNELTTINIILGCALIIFSNFLISINIQKFKT